HVLSLIEGHAKLAKASPCHFDQREKPFLDPSHSLGMTGPGRVTWRLCAFAGVISFSLPKSGTQIEIANIFG
ncbi:MAG: hypothetical protein U1E51_18815, partial [Candidatus Binatia bacterium]|nr:hypothetical protein [Candidatus Binatia bacterium]